MGADLKPTFSEDELDEWARIENSHEARITSLAIFDVTHRECERRCRILRRVEEDLARKIDAVDLARERAGAALKSAHEAIELAEDAARLCGYAEAA